MKEYSKETLEIISEWGAIRARHPMIGEGMSPDSLAAIWEGASKTYSESNYAKIRDIIVDKIVSAGLVTEDRSLLDIGCGHGAFSIPLSRHARRTVCTDISRGMLNRIECLDLSNVATVCSDCFTLSEDLRSDVVFSSLCPPMNSVKGILTMEEMAFELCIYVSSTNSCPGIETEIWKALGSDYTYAGSNTEYPYRFLKSIGRNPELEFISQDLETRESSETLVSRFVSKVSRYRVLTDESKRIIRDVVESHSEEGIVHQKNVMTLGLLVWSV